MQQNYLGSQFISVLFSKQKQKVGSFKWLLYSSICHKLYVKAKRNVIYLSSYHILSYVQQIYENTLNTRLFHNGYCTSFYNVLCYSISYSNTLGLGKVLCAIRKHITNISVPTVGYGGQQQTWCSLGSCGFDPSAACFIPFIPSGSYIGRPGRLSIPALATASNVRSYQYRSADTSAGMRKRSCC